MATAANVVKLKRSAVAGRVPATTDLQLGELALNTNDGVLYYKKSPGGVDSIVALQPITAGSSIAVSASGVVSLAANVAITGTLTDGQSNVGTSGQILSSTGTGVKWVNSSTSPATSSSLGVVQVDGTTIVANGSGVISAQSLVNGSYSAVLDSTGTLTVNNLTVNATTTVNSQTLVVQGIGNLLLSQDGQYLTLPNGQPIASNNAYNVAIIGANTGSFYFSSGGTLKLPPNGDIIDSNGNSVLNLNGRVVSYGVSQSLTSAQQLTARTNIGLDDATLYFYCYMFG